MRRRRAGHGDGAGTAELSAGRGLLVDIGGVLVPDYVREAAVPWAASLGITPAAFLAAIYAGNDDGVLIGRVPEDAWWQVVAGRLGLPAAGLARLRADLASREVWDPVLVALLRSLRGRVRTGLLSNAWPEQRTRLARAGLLDLVDEVILSCEVGYAKPDLRIYTLSATRLGVPPAQILFIDDTEPNVHAAQALGMTAHLHTDTATTSARIEAWVRRSG